MVGVLYALAATGEPPLGSIADLPDIRQKKSEFMYLHNKNKKPNTFQMK